MDQFNTGQSGDAEIELYEKKLPPMDTIIRDKVDMIEKENREDPFFIVDLGEVYRKLEQWWGLLPRVQPFYAVKCNNDQEVTRFLADAGVGFDCATKAEIEQILELGVHPSRIVYANPCKQCTHLQYAASTDVRLMTFDGGPELVKIKKYFPEAKLLLRIQCSRDHNAVHNFNKKFGCDPAHARALLTQARNLGLNVVGVSFHVGSLPDDVSCYASTIASAHSVFKIGEELGYSMDILDIGGGFPGVEEEQMSFSVVAEVINIALDELFPASSGVKVIAEPGRYFVSSAFTVAVNVIAKRVVDREEDDEDLQAMSECNTSEVTILEEVNTEAFHNGDAACTHDNGEDNQLYMYYVSDGIYGSFNNVFTDHAVIYPIILKKPSDSCKTPPLPRDRPSLIWGPTCDGLDLVMQDCRLPELEVGQWLYFHNMGAYTISLSCNFNGISRPLRFYVCADSYWNKVYPVINTPSPGKPLCELSIFDTDAADVMPDGTTFDPLKSLDHDLRPRYDRQRKDSHRLSLSKGQ